MKAANWPRNILKIRNLAPEIKEPSKRVLNRLQELGWKPRIAEGRRTAAQQMEKVRKGYSKTMNSWHIPGLAIDIIDKRYAWSGPASNQEFQFWKDLGRIGKEEGFEWGGDWRWRDVAHLQLPIKGRR